MKKVFLASLLFGALFTACSNDDDYNAGIASPQKSDPTVTQSIGDITVAKVATINLADVTDEKVKVADITLPTPTSENAKLDSMEVCFFDENENQLTKTGIDTEGKISTEVLVNLIESTYGKRPVERNLFMGVLAYYTDNTQSFLLSSDLLTVTAIPEAPVIEDAYYLTGSINGWNNTDTTYKMTNGGADPYENPVFTMRIPAPADGSNVEFKMTPESGLGGDWGQCLAAGAEEGKFNYGNNGGNLVITAVEGALFYDLTFNMLDQTWSYKAISFGPVIYFIGATDGWAKAEQKLALTDDNGIYTGYIYCADPNGWGNEFKFQKEADNWDTEINSGMMTAITGDFADGGGNFKATAGEGVYYVTLDMAAMTLNAEYVKNMNLVGDFNGWNPADDAQQMTWNAVDYCFEITGAGVTSNGWKFTINNAWDVNLGGTADNLTAGGDNLSVVGTTIKLYPTRKDSNKIYCTVE